MVLGPKVPFLFALSYTKITGMDDIPNPNQTTEIARAYLRQLRQRGGSTDTMFHKPDVLAWLELEESLMPGSQPKSSKQIEPTLQPRGPAIKTDKKQSIWKRPISELWR